MFANPIWYFVCIGVVFVFALIFRLLMNRAVNKAIKEGRMNWMNKTCEAYSSSSDDWRTTSLDPSVNCYTDED